MEFIINDLDALQQAAQKLLDFASDRKKMIFTGDIGAGKTTFIQYICKHLGVEEAVTSPTFPIINQYILNSKDRIYHIDLYRLKSEAEAIDIGIEDYLFDENYCFIEWPQIIENLLPEEIVRISIETLDDSTRKMIFL